MNKYIINNCPCYEHSFCTSPHIKSPSCRNCTDCVIKKAVELCIDNEKYGDGYNTDPILQLFDVQEVEGN